VSLFHPFIASCGTDGLVVMTNIFPLKSSWKVIFTLCLRVHFEILDQVYYIEFKKKCCRETVGDFFR